MYGGFLRTQVEAALFPEGDEDADQDLDIHFVVSNMQNAILLIEMCEEENVTVLCTLTAMESLTRVLEEEMRGEDPEALRRVAAVVGRLERLTPRATALRVSREPRSVPEARQAEARPAPLERAQTFDSDDDGVAESMGSESLTAESIKLGLTEIYGVPSGKGDGKPSPTVCMSGMGTIECSNLFSE